MSKGKRYEEPKLNLKKVFAVILAIIVIIMFIFMIRGFLTEDGEQTKIVSKDYFSAFQNNKWGVIDSTGAVVIDPSYEEMITIPNSKKDVFLCIFDINYDTGEYSTKALNSKNEEIFTQYDQIEAIQVVDNNNQVSYISNVLKVQKDGKYGLINLDGKELQTCQYDEVSSLQGMQDAIKVQKDGKYGLVNTDGKEIIPTQYADIQELDKEDTSNFVVMNDDGKYGIVSNNNQIILPTNYEQIKNVYSNNYYVVQKDGNEILVQKNGTEITLNGVDQITEILKNEEGVIFTQGENYGVMNLSGEVIIESVYQDLKETKTGIFIAEQNDKYGIIDLQKNENLEFVYQNIDYYEKADLYVGEDESFNNSIIDNNFEVKQTGILINIDEEKGYFELRQNDGYIYYNFNFETKKDSEIFTNRTLFLRRKDGKFGFVDKDGNVVVDYIYDDATEQNDYGYVGVKKDGKWGSIDERGNVIQEPTYNLDDYLKIDFIGRWHYGKDLNMNYYNQL